MTKRGATPLSLSTLLSSQHTNSRTEKSSPPSNGNVKSFSAIPSSFYCNNHNQNTRSNVISHHAKRQYTTHSQLPEEHQMIYEMCRKFADEELAPNAGKWDQEHSFPTDAVSQLVSRNSFES